MISTAETDNAKAEELAFMLQTMGNSMPMELSQIILTDIARLRKMPELAKRLEEYQPQPDPVEEKMKELQVMELQAKIDKLVSEAEENRAEAELDKAKARETQSSADNADLNFMEQESGVTQEREKELLGEQAQSNLERDIVNQFLKGGNEGNSSAST
jgi:hypothetical protein